MDRRREDMESEVIAHAKNPTLPWLFLAPLAAFHAA
jgi:hypothetical protein